MGKKFTIYLGCAVEWLVKEGEDAMQDRNGVWMDEVSA